MADLATLVEFKEFLGVSGSGEDSLLTTILDAAEATFERECGRGSTPFVAAQTGRIEYRDGTGTCQLFLDYSISVLTSITLGFDHAAPVETLTVANLVYGADSRRITRTDGWFGRFGAARYVKVTYDAAADLPADAKLAVLVGAASVYQHRGSEGIKSETMGPYSVTYFDPGTVAAFPPIWAAAVAAHTRAA